MNGPLPVNAGLQCHHTASRWRQRIVRSPVGAGVGAGAGAGRSERGGGGERGGGADAGAGHGAALTASQHGDAHLGAPPARGRPRGAAVLGALSDGVPQPAERVGPAVRQRVRLPGDTRVQLSAVPLPDQVHVRRTWGHTGGQACPQTPRGSTEGVRPWRGGAGGFRYPSWT